MVVNFLFTLASETRELKPNLAQAQSCKTRSETNIGKWRNETCCGIENVYPLTQWHWVQYTFGYYPGIQSTQKQQSDTVCMYVHYGWQNCEAKNRDKWHESCMSHDFLFLWVERRSQLRIYTEKCCFNKSSLIERFVNVGKFEVRVGNSQWQSQKLWSLGAVIQW